MVSIFCYVKRLEVWKWFIRLENCSYTLQGVYVALNMWACSITRSIQPSWIHCHNQLRLVLPEDATISHVWQWKWNTPLVSHASCFPSNRQKIWQDMTLIGAFTRSPRKNRWPCVAPNKKYKYTQRTRLVICIWCMLGNVFVLFVQDFLLIDTLFQALHIYIYITCLSCPSFSVHNKLCCSFCVVIQE